MLALDATDRHISAAYLGPGGDRLLASEAGAAEMLPELLNQLLSDLANNAGVRINDVAWCACSVGPGSHTGIRAALAIGKALNVASRTPLVAVDRFSQLAAAGLEQKKLSGGLWHIVVPAGRQMVAVQTLEIHQDLQRFQAQDAVRSLNLDEFFSGASTGSWLIDARITARLPAFGTGATVARRVDIDADARYAASASRQLVRSGAHIITDGTIAPFYLRPVDAKLTAGQPLIRPVAARRAPCHPAAEG